MRNPDKEMTVRDKFIVGVRHYYNDIKKTWGMQYSVRYGKWKFYNYEMYLETYRCDIQPEGYPVWIPAVSRWGHPNSFDIRFRKFQKGKNNLKKSDILRNRTIYEMEKITKSKNLRNRAIYDIGYLTKSDDPIKVTCNYRSILEEITHSK